MANARQFDDVGEQPILDRAIALDGEGPDLETDQRDDDRALGPQEARHLRPDLAVDVVGDAGRPVREPEADELDLGEHHAAGRSRPASRRRGPRPSAIAKV